MINNVSITGRLTKQPELKQTTNGIAKLSFTVAVNRSFTNAKGEREADFINCVAWRKTAETMANNLQKGSLVGIEGRISTRNFDGKDGNRVFMTEVDVEKFSFLEPRADNQQSGNMQPTTQQPQTNQYQEQSQQYQQPINNQQPQTQYQQPHENQYYSNQQPQYTGANNGYGGNQGYDGGQNYPDPGDDLPF